MLDCEIALEENGKPKCYNNNFDKFELEQNEEVCKSYLKAFDEEYGLYEILSMKNNLIEANEIIKSFYCLFKNFTFGTQNYQNLISRTEKFLFYEEDKKNNISNDIPFENFMSSAKEEWDDRLRT
jgi:hypothetical protein